MSAVDLDVPDSPMNLTMTNRSYSSISIQWEAGFDGGWPQTFSILLNQRLWKDVNRTSFIFEREFAIVQNRLFDTDYSWNGKHIL
jgi:hypothetical protein